MRRWCWTPTLTSPAAPPSCRADPAQCPDPAARRLLVEQGDIDIARGLGADQIDALKKEGKLNVSPYLRRASDYLLINTKANAALGNPAFWKAARYLVDYEGIAKTSCAASIRYTRPSCPPASCAERHSLQA